ncbi:helix-turn-helix domain-containing protein [Foetidibacter luteolus]|uniref:helix-turn-helix domain-containing protein n=1 Tax=Foetidibacter luteolus TaxID=2608880 RepID=UPI00129B374A|nr:AraC family transcriptional regulator [Foetidibacter luteolus]
MPAEPAFIIAYQNDDSWFPQIAPQLCAEYNACELAFDNEIGKGNFYKVDIEPGLRARKIEVTFNKPVKFLRNSTAHPGYYILLSNLSEQCLETTTQEKTVKLGYNTENGLYFSSPQLSASYNFLPGVAYHLIFIVITSDRLQNFITRQPGAQLDILKTVVDKDHPIYHFECMDAYFMSLLKEMDLQLHAERANNLLLHAKTLELCYHMLQQVEKRQSKNNLKNIHHADVDRLNEVRQQLMEHYQEPCPTIEQAARNAAMSPTKFKNLFRQMFGQTYYQYYKNIRMYKAKELLQQQKMNVSEVGYMLGYQSLSKFTKAFKDVFSITPGNLVAD